MIPEWAPNLHPLIVHFPIALLFVAVAVDLVALVLRRIPFLQSTAVVLYLLGLIGLIGAYVTGNAAAETVDVPAQALATFTDHQDWALWTLLFFGVYGVLRFALWSVGVVRPAVIVPAALAGFAGLYLLWQTTEQGARLVYVHGVGIQAVDEMAEQLRAFEHQLAATDAAPVVSADGSWRWRTGEGADLALDQSFEWIEGAPDEVQAQVIESERGPVLELVSTDAPVLFAVGELIQSVQVEAEVNIDDFNGSLMLVHNVIDADNYHFLAIEAERAIQGRLTNGNRETIQEGSYQSSGWVTLRASGDQTHFYAYVNGQMVAHGHVSAPAPGYAGIRMAGSGPVLIQLIEVTSLR